MKAVKILIGMLLAALSVNAQTVTPNPGPYQNISTKYQYTWQKWSGGIWNAGKARFDDSTQFLGPVYVPNTPILDSSTQAMNTGSMRRYIADYVTPGTPDIPAAGWGTSGTNAAPLPLGYNIGTKDSFPLPIWTNGQLRMEIPADGITRKSATGANKMLVIDTVNKKVYYSDVPGGGGGSGTVTNVATGYGVSGGPITTTGTITADTTLLASHTRLANYIGLSFVSISSISDSSFSLNRYNGTKDTVTIVIPPSIDTTAAFVIDVSKVNDSTIRVHKGATFTDLEINGNGTGGAGGGLADSAYFWKRTGNYAVPRAEFIGSLDTSQFHIRTKNIQAISIDTLQNVGINLPSPSTHHLSNPNSKTLSINSTGYTFIDMFQGGLAATRIQSDSTDLRIFHKKAIRFGDTDTDAIDMTLTTGTVLSSSVPITITNTGGNGKGVNIYSSSASSFSSLDLNTSAGLAGQLFAAGPSYSNGILRGNNISLYNSFTSGGIVLVGAGTSGYVGLGAGGYADANERLRVNASGNVIVGSSLTTNVPSSILTLNSTTQGMLLPRMTKTQRDAITSPATGLAIFQTDNTPGLRVWNGTNWMKFTETAD